MALTSWPQEIFIQTRNRNLLARHISSNNSSCMSKHSSPPLSCIWMIERTQIMWSNWRSLFLLAPCWRCYGISLKKNSILQSDACAFIVYLPRNSQEFEMSLRKTDLVPGRTSVSSSQCQQEQWWKCQCLRGATPTGSGGNIVSCSSDTLKWTQTWHLSKGRFCLSLSLSLSPLHRKHLNLEANQNNVVIVVLFIFMIILFTWPCQWCTVQF